MNKSKKINISYIDPSSLFPAQYNPRKWDKVVVEKLTESIKRFGMVDPLIVNSSPERKNIVIGGHFRLEVAKKLGIKKVPIVYINISDKDTEKELNLRLNRNTGQWDYNLLKEFDTDLLLDIGFDDSDITSIWDETLRVEDDGFDVEKELKKITAPKTKPGDIYRLGSHVLACGDSTDKSFIDSLARDFKVDMAYLDPSYNISLDYNRGIGTKGKYGGTLTKDNKTLEEYRMFLKSSISNALTKAKKDCHIFCYCDQGYIGLLQDLYKDLEISNKRVCIWVKNSQNVTPQIAFNKAFESCIYGITGRPYLSSSLKNLSEILNKEVGTGNQMITDIYDLFDIWLQKRIATQKYCHPAEKLLSLHEKPIRRCTKVGDIILDTFGGSGSTLMACEQLKRRCIMSEIEPIFCDLIISRFEKLTGKEPKHVN